MVSTEVASACNQMPVNTMLHGDWSADVWSTWPGVGCQKAPQSRGGHGLLVACGALTFPRVGGAKVLRATEVDSCSSSDDVVVPAFVSDGRPPCRCEWRLWRGSESGARASGRRMGRWDGGASVGVVVVVVVVIVVVMMMVVKALACTGACVCMGACVFVCECGLSVVGGKTGASERINH
jgi:hypothetical protein